jgi:hypothetical protein
VRLTLHKSHVTYRVNKTLDIAIFRVTGWMGCTLTQCHAMHRNTCDLHHITSDRLKHHEGVAAVGPHEHGVAAACKLGIGWRGGRQVFCLMPTVMSEAQSPC